MKAIFPLLFAALLLAALPAKALEQKQRAADAAVGKWLALLDGQAYRESWHEAASLFRLQVNLQQWMQSIRAARQPLGNMTSRELVNATYTTTLPGAPDGEYVVLQYRTSFEHKKNAIETVTPMLDEGSWRVSGYYVR